VLSNPFKPNPSHEELTRAEFDALFRQYYKTIRNFIYFRCGDRDMAEDIAQDTFVKLWEVRDRVDRKTVKSYLYTIAQNTTINQQKRQQLMYKFQKRTTLQLDSDTPEKLAEMAEYELRLQSVIASLPEGGREVFLMNRIEDLTYQEIAERLGLSVKAIEKRMSKVLRIIRAQLGVDI
jgi:RNA polymerase sigma-70 factor (family 1)